MNTGYHIATRCSDTTVQRHRSPLLFRPSVARQCLLTGPDPSGGLQPDDDHAIIVREPKR